MTHIRKITRKKWIDVMGFEPQHDDLDRANCTKVGEIGHMSCGWDFVLDEPRFNSNSKRRVSARVKHGPSCPCSDCT